MPKKIDPEGWSTDLQTSNPRAKGTTTQNPHSEAPTQTRLRSQVATYDKWFLAEVAQALKEADNPATLWLDNATVMAESARRRADWGSAKAISDSAAHRPER